MSQNVMLANYVQQPEIHLTYNSKTGIFFEPDVYSFEGLL